MSAVKGKTLLLLPAALAVTYLAAGASGALEIDSQLPVLSAPDMELNRMGMLIRLSRHTMGTEVLREAVLSRLEEPWYMNNLTMREAEMRVQQGHQTEDVFRDFSKVREVLSAYLEATKKWRLEARMSSVGAGRGIGDIIGGGILDGIIDGIIDQILEEIVGKIFDNIESNIEDLIDEVAAAIDDAVDHLITVGGESLGDLIESIEDGLGDLLDHWKDEGYFGVPIQFDSETRQAILDIRDDIDILIIILGVIVAIFGVAQMAHAMDQVFIRRWQIQQFLRFEKHGSTEKLPIK